jgi:subtilisin family serine protease
LTGKYFPPVNAAVKALVDLGIHVTVAAGNYFGANSCNFSPASAPEAVTAGATSIDDFIPTFSSSGPCVDLFAPGNMHPVIIIFIYTYIHV